LDRVVDRVIASEYIQPLIGLPGAREQQYAVTAVLANEYTIAETIERLVAKPGPDVPKHLLHRAVSEKTREVDGTLSDGQVQAVANICGPQTAVRVIVGIAGAGKTTALDAASDALEAARYQVIGTATSGQAAQNLGREARVWARTMRSLLARLDRGTISLDERTVVILDEAGMTADADLARLLLAVERAGAKIVLVGDHRQLAAVGPGGALEAVLNRHPNVATTLTENMRQHDPAERAALAALRSGSVDTAIDFYVANDRIQVAPRQLDTMYEMVSAYVADRQAGHDTFMLAWRRESVAALNRFARIRARDLGWITGDDLETPGGRSYAFGDPVVTLQPNYEAELVTSQRGQVVGIDHDAKAISVRIDDGRRVVLSGEAIDKDHLALGYALTVHREQGATADRTHFLAEGGGRQLAYVAMSRARDTSTVWAVGDDGDMALDPIRYDWSNDQNQHWISDQADIGQDPYTQPAPPDFHARRLALRAELTELERQAPLDVSDELAVARRQLHHLEQDLHDLTTGTGRWRHTPQGQSVRALLEISARRRALAAKTERARSPFERSRLHQAAQTLSNEEAHHRELWDRLVRPAKRHLRAAVQTTSGRVAKLEQAAAVHEEWLDQHPELARRLDQLARELREIDQALMPSDAEPDTPDSRVAEIADDPVARVRQRLDDIQRRAVERSADVSVHR
jgi:hypothetical protein